MNRKTVQTAKELCRDLRRRSTRGEEIFWDAVRNRKIDGKKFLRQHPIFFSYMNTDTFFIADFYCHEKKLVIEIDGKSHDYQKEYDELRTHIINALAIDVIRFRNEDIEKNISKVIENLQVVLKGSHPCAKGASASGGKSLS
jgi:very-short-patch-repair endonuclease